MREGEEGEARGALRRQVALRHRERLVVMQLLTARWRVALGRLLPSLSLCPRA